LARLARTHWPYAAVAAFFLADGAALGYAVLPEDAPDGLVAVVVVAGQVVDPEGDVAGTLREIAREYRRGKIAIVGHGYRKEIRRADLGARVDLARMERLVREAADPGSPLARLHKGDGDPVRLPMAVEIDASRAIPLLLQIKQEFDHPAREARIDLATRAIQPEQAGRRMEVFQTLGNLDTALATGRDEAQIAREVVAPHVLARTLERMDVSHVLGYFETQYALDRKHADRSFNLRLAASKLDGQILMPGEVFSFNEAVGERSEIQGYRVAPVIAAGELVDGIGGGTCQVASTFHAASYFAGLDIVERRPHSRPSYYVRMGLDATVVYPNIDLEVRNPYEFPLAVQFAVQGGVARAQILGPNMDRRATFIRHIDEVQPFPERVIDDGDLPAGVWVLTQRGIPGYRIRRFRLTERGRQAVVERSRDVYPATTQIWRRGTRPVPREAVPIPANDDHPEYVADVYLRVTQGYGIDGIDEVHRAGRSGTKSGRPPVPPGSGGNAASTGWLVD